MLPALLLDVFMCSINFIFPPSFELGFSLCMMNRETVDRLMLLSIHVLLILNGHFLIRSSHKTVLTMQPETQ